MTRIQDPMTGYTQLLPDTEGERHLMALAIRALDGFPHSLPVSSQPDERASIQPRHWTKDELEAQVHIRKRDADPLSFAPEVVYPIYYSVWERPDGKVEVRWRYPASPHTPFRQSNILPHHPVL